MADRQHTPNRNREQKLKQRYRISEKDYNAMLEKQQGRCGICGRFRKLVVDHSHTSHKVRGLLCSNCNSGFGLFEESVRVLQAAIRYAKLHKGGK